MLSLRRRPIARHAVFYQAEDQTFYSYGSTWTWCLAWVIWFCAAGWLLRERGAGGDKQHMGGHFCDKNGWWFFHYGDDVVGGYQTEDEALHVRGMLFSRPAKQETR